MPERFEQIPFPDPEFVDNPEPRCPCVLLLDTSGSMNDEKKVAHSISPIQRTLGQEDGYIESLEADLKRHPEGDKGRLTLTLLYALQDKYRPAVKHYRTLKKRRPDVAASLHQELQLHGVNLER